MATATKATLKTNELAGIRTLLNGCIGVLNGIAEMFPEYTTQHGTITGETPPNPVKRGRGNWKVEPGGKKAA